VNRLGRLDTRFRVALATVGVFGGLFTCAAAFGWGLRTAVSVAVGAAIAATNLYALGLIVAAVLPSAEQEGQRNPLLWGVAALLKMIVLFGGIWMLMAAGLVSPLPLLVGYGSLPIGIAIGSLVSDRNEPRGESTREPR